MNITELLAEHNIPVAGPNDNHYAASRGWAQVDCPMCSPGSRRFRLGFKGMGAYCFSCGKVRLGTALSLLTGKHWSAFQDFIRDLPHDTHERPKGRLKIPHGVGPLQSAHERYLVKRGFDPLKIVRTWGVQAIGLSSRLPWRLFLPIEHNGETVSWTTRAISNVDKIKYVGARPEEETIPAKSLLFGEQFARHSILVVEGPLDCFAGGPGTVATMGTAWTPAQLNRIAAYPSRAICMDSEPAAQKRAADLCDALSAMPGKTTRVELESGKDLAEADPAEVRMIREKFLEG